MVGCVQPVLFHGQAFADVSFELWLYACPSPAPRERPRSVKPPVINAGRGSPESLQPAWVRGRAERELAGVLWEALSGGPEDPLLGLILLSKYNMFISDLEENAN